MSRRTTANRRRTRTLGAGLLLLASSACGETDECKSLKSLKPEYERVAQLAAVRSSVTMKLEMRLKSAEKESEAYLDSLGLNDPEGKTQKTLEQRIAETEGTKIVRGSWAAEGQETSETLWRILFDAADFESASALMWKVIEEPPLILFKTLILDAEKESQAWRLEVVRARVERATITPEAIPLPTLQDIAKIESNIGFCGAGKLRKEIGALARTIAEKRANAEKTTVLLPTLATWEGLKWRAEILKAREDETRRLVKLLLEAVGTSGVKFKAIGYEDPLVVLEVWGGAEDRKKLEGALVSVASLIKKPPVAAPEVVRIALENQVAAKAAKGPQKQGDEHLKPDPQLQKILEDRAREREARLKALTAPPLPPDAGVAPKPAPSTPDASGDGGPSSATDAAAAAPDAGAAAKP